MEKVAVDSLVVLPFRIGIRVLPRHVRGLLNGPRVC